MPQTMPLDARLLLVLESQRVGPGPCVHDTVWVVDVASRRVIRRVCDTCVVTQGAVRDADGPCEPHPYSGRVPNTRN